MTVTMLAGDLCRALSDALPFVCTDTCLPQITVVRIETSDGTLSATATDRYTLGHSRAACTGDLPAPFSLPTAAARQVIRLFKPPRRIPFGPGPRVAVDYNPDTWIATFSPAREDGPALFAEHADIGHEVRVKTRDEKYPEYHKLIDRAPAAAEHTGAAYGLNPWLLARFDKVTGTPGMPMRVWMGRRTKPVVVQIGDTFVGIIMPVRLPEYADAEQPTIPFGHQPRTQKPAVAAVEPVTAGTAA
jgi:hypothetical protein